MPGTKEIRTKIASVKSTQKITKAMQMVATSKMRRAQERMKLARPYAEKMRTVIAHLNEANPDFRHPFLISREVKAIGIIIISTDRGLGRRLEREPVQAGTAADAGMAEQGRSGESVDHRQQGHGILPQAWHPHAGQRRRTR